MSKPIAILIAIVIVAGVYGAYKLHSRRRKEDEPMVSLVCLLGERRQITEKELRTAASAAFDVTFEENNPDATRFVVAMPAPSANGPAGQRAATFMVNVDQGMFLVHSWPVPYMDNPESFAADIADKRLGSAIRAHNAWLSVDAFGELENEKDKEEAYRAIGKLVATLLGRIGPDCLALHSPELGRCNEYNPQLLERLRSGDPLSLFEDPTFAPVIHVAEDDPRMIKAVAEARSRWPEFVAAFRANPVRESPFLIKAEFREGDKAEFMWVSVESIDATTIHGTLENEPHELTLAKMGGKVSVPLSSLNDWFYQRGEKAEGGFTMKVIADAAKK